MVTQTSLTNRGLKTEGDSGVKGKTQRVYCSGKRPVLRLELKESREGFVRRDSGRSFRVEGPKTKKKTREATVESLALPA